MKNLLAFLLSVVMVFTMTPVIAFAAGPEETVGAAAIETKSEKSVNAVNINATDIARIGNTGYATLAEAFAAATGGTEANPVEIDVLVDELPSFVLTTDEDAKASDEMTDEEIEVSDYQRIPDYIKLVAKDGGTTIKGHVELNGAYYFTMSGFTFDAQYAVQVIGAHHSTLGVMKWDGWDCSVMDNYQDNWPCNSNHGNDGSKYVCFENCTFAGTYSGSNEYSCVGHARVSQGEYPGAWHFQSCVFETINATSYLDIRYISPKEGSDISTYPTFTVENCTFGSSESCCKDNLLGTTGVYGMVTVKNNTFNGPWAADAKAVSLGGGEGRPTYYHIEGNEFNYVGTEDVVSIQIKQANEAYINDNTVTCDQLNTNQISAFAEDNMNVGSGTYSPYKLAYKYENRTPVCRIGDKKYTSIKAAVTAANTGDTIELISNVILGSELVAWKKVTLDLNGYDIDAGTNSIKVENGDLNITGKGEISGVPSNGKLIYLVGDTNSETKDYSNITIGKDVTVKCTNGYAMMLSTENNKGYGVNMNIKGTVKGYDGAICIDGSVSPCTGNVPTVIIESTAKLKSEHEGFAVIYAAGYGAWNITGGVFEGDSAVYIKTGKINISGGEFNATGDKVEYEYCSSGYKATGDAIVVDNCKCPGGKPDVSIAGGTFKSKNAKAVGSYCGNDENVIVNNFISGGWFSNKISNDYVATGYVPTDFRDEGPAVAKYTVEKAAAESIDIKSEVKTEETAKAVVEPSKSEASVDKKEAEEMLKDKGITSGTATLTLNLEKEDSSSTIKEKVDEDAIREHDTKKVMYYVDATVSREVKDAEGRTVGTIEQVKETSTFQVMALKITEELKTDVRATATDKSGYNKIFVYRDHNGTVSKLRKVSIDSFENVNEECYAIDYDDDLIMIKANKFSVYGVGAQSLAVAESYSIKFYPYNGSSISNQMIELGEKVSQPADPKKSGYDFEGWYSDSTLNTKYDFNDKVSKDINLFAKWNKSAVKKAAPFFVAKTVSFGSKKLKASWTAYEGASSYAIYASRCNTSKKKFVTKKVANTTALNYKIKRISGKKLKKHTFYKVYVVALDKDGNELGRTNVMHVTTGKYKGKYGNAKSITAKYTNRTVNIGATTTVVVKKLKTWKGKKVPKKSHAPKIRYLSDNVDIATVNANGVVTGIAAGTCTIYMQAANGLWTTTQVTVQ